MPAFHYFLKNPSTLQSFAPLIMKVSAMNRYRNANSFFAKGSAQCTPTSAVTIVNATKKPAKRVSNPNANRIPPTNSDKPAAHAKNVGIGNPIFAVAFIIPSLGGIFPNPCASANETPANILTNVNPAFAANDNPDSPPKSMLLSKPLNLP